MAAGAICSLPGSSVSQTLHEWNVFDGTPESNPNQTMKPHSPMHNYVYTCIRNFESTGPPLSISSPFPGSHPLCPIPIPSSSRCEAPAPSFRLANSRPSEKCQGQSPSPRSHSFPSGIREATVSFYRKDTRKNQGWDENRSYFSRAAPPSLASSIELCVNRHDPPRAIPPSVLACQQSKHP